MSNKSTSARKISTASKRGEILHYKGDKTFDTNDSVKNFVWNLYYELTFVKWRFVI